MENAQALLDAIRAGLSQQSRLLKLNTLLSPNVLLPHRVVAHDRVGRGYEYTVDVLSLQGDIELKQLIAQLVTPWIQQADQHSYLPIHGYAHQARMLGHDGQFTAYQLTFSSWLHFLKFRQDARIWQDQTADNILVDVFHQHPQTGGRYRFDLEQAAASRSYCTQYETDWHFLMRLMEEEGWHCYHEQKEDGSDYTLVITDTVRGVGIARIGDMVTCPQSGHGTNAIVKGSPTFTIGGRKVALHGHRCDTCNEKPH